MGLFDRFKKKTKDAVDRNEITVEEGTNEAAEVLQKREELLSAIEKLKSSDPSIDNTQFLETKEDEWDDFSDEKSKNPFAKMPDLETRFLVGFGIRGCFISIFIQWIFFLEKTFYITRRWLQL